MLLMMLMRSRDYCEKCLPVALKEALNMPTIPNAATTLKYLKALWYLPALGDIFSKYAYAATNGLLYLLDYIDPVPSIWVAEHGLYEAVLNKHLDIVSHLLNISVRNEYDQKITLSSKKSLMEAVRDALHSDANAISYFDLFARRGR